MNPLDYIIYEPLPAYFTKSYDHNKKLGYNNLTVTPDSYDINLIPARHCGFQHIKQITIPKIEKIKDSIDGFFIIEGDIIINEDYTYDKFLEEKHRKPIWLGYKKKLSNYIVGNFLIFIPIRYFTEFKILISNQKNVYSDRFFTKLVKSNWLKLRDTSVATEIPHTSNVLLQSTSGKSSFRK